MSPQDVLTTRLLSNGAKLAVFGEPLVEAGDSPVEESVATFVRRRFNQEVLDYVANPFVAGIYAGDPEQLSVRHALPKLYGLERTPRLGHQGVRRHDAGTEAGRRDGGRGADRRDGLVPARPAGAPDALARELHAEIRLRAPVTQLRSGPKGWTVGAAYQTSELYDGVVYAAPAHCIDEIELDFPGRRPPEDARQHRPPAGRGAGARVPSGGRRTSAGRIRVPGAGGRAPARARRHLLLDAVPGTGAGRSRACSPRSWAASGIPTWPTPTSRTITARVHGRPARAARRQGRAHLPRLPALAQGHSAVRSQLRPVQGDHGRGRAAESRRSRWPAPTARAWPSARPSPRAKQAATRPRRALPAARGIRAAGERTAPRRHPRQRARALADRARPGAAATPRGTRPSGSRSATTGDMVQDVPLSQIGSRALFTRQIDDAMLDGRIDLAVHSLKDLPTDAPGRDRARRGGRAGGSRATRWWAAARCGGATCRRARWSPRSSLRRRAQLLHLRPDLQIRDIRGNVDTRLAKLDAQHRVDGHPARDRGSGAARPGRPDRPAPAARADAAGARAGGARRHGADRRRTRRGRGGAAVHHTGDGAGRGRGAGVPPDAGGRMPGAGRRARRRPMPRGGSGCTDGSSRSAASAGWRGSRRAWRRTNSRPTGSACRWRSGCWTRARRRFSPRCAPASAPAVPEP